MSLASNLRLVVGDKKLDWKSSVLKMKPHFTLAEGILLLVGLNLGICEVSLFLLIYFRSLTLFMELEIQ